MQQQFLHVLDRDEAERRFLAAIELAPGHEEVVSLEQLLGRVLSRDVVARVDVPSFDRANYDGFAVQAADTFGADEEQPREVRIGGASVTPGVGSHQKIGSQEAIAIATGAVVPRGADAVAMIEQCDLSGAGTVLIRRAISAGFGIAFAGTDIAAGETVLRAGDGITSRETGVLAAIGVAQAYAWRVPRVAIVSTGDEIVAPGEPMQAGQVYDCNARILADAVRELGGEPVPMGIVGDDAEALREVVAAAIAQADIVLLSGGTSKGQGDLCYQIVDDMTSPGIVAHGVALKPGKPVCLASHHGQPIVILPGFPTSAIFTFHEFVAPIIRMRAGRSRTARATLPASMAVRVNSEIGRTEYLLVGLVEQPEENPGEGSKGRAATTLVAYPMGKGSGSITTFSHADGFISIGRHVEIVDAGTTVDVQLIGNAIEPADLIVIGSHCVGLDYLLGELQRRGWRTKYLAVGSTAGLEAVRRGECDLAGIHLLDPDSGTYNRPFLDGRQRLVRGYPRRQGIVYRRGDIRFEGKSVEEALRAACSDPECLMINRNQGSGTRILIDQLLDRVVAGQLPAGYPVQAKNHNAVAAAIRQSRADWGVAIENVTQLPPPGTAGADQPLGFLFLADEQYDFVVPCQREQRPAVQAFRELLSSTDLNQILVPAVK